MGLSGIQRHAGDALTQNNATHVVGERQQPISNFLKKKVFCAASPLGAV